MIVGNIRLWLLPGVVVSAFACATGAETEDTEIPYAPTLDAGPKPDAKSTTQALDAGLADAPQPNADAAGKPDASSDASANGSDAGKVVVDAGPTTSDASTNSTCTPSNACTNSVDLGSIAGDDHSEWTGATGYQGSWLKVRLREDEHGLTAKSLKAQLWVEHATSSIFDLYVYDACGGTPLALSTDVASSHVINLSFPDNKSLNGSDDSRDLFVEVRYRSGVCSAQTPWTMYVVGNR